MDGFGYLGSLVWAVGISFIFLIHFICETSSMGAGVPCLYEGHLKTDRNWFGFLANITIMATGRMTFQLSYPADKCCQNILFYLEDQVSILNARMNCWQKESLLRPEDDQILRLTPRFSWSGCHMTHPNGVSRYICEGGRSFTSTSAGDRPTTWYLTVSNCASLMGLELKYRIEVMGHIGECSTPMTPKPTMDTNMILPDGDHSRQSSGESALSVSSSDSQICAVEGELNTTTDWYGYIANVTLKKGGGFRFRFSYPTNKFTQNILLYGIKNVRKLRPQHSCWQKEGVILAEQVADQILDLTVRSSWNGCVVRNSTTQHGETLICQGERRYNTPRKIFIAVSNCRARNGLFLKYRLEFFGYTGRPCAGANSNLQVSSPLYILVMLLWSVIAIREYQGSLRLHSSTEIKAGR